MYACVYIYIYIYIYMCVYTYVYIYIYIYREREREREMYTYICLGGVHGGGSNLGVSFRDCKTLGHILDLPLCVTMEQCLISN